MLPPSPKLFDFIWIKVLALQNGAFNVLQSSIEYLGYFCNMVDGDLSIHLDKFQ